MLFFIDFTSGSRIRIGLAKQTAYSQQDYIQAEYLHETDRVEWTSINIIPTHSIQIISAINVIIDRIDKQLVVRITHLHSFDRSHEKFGVQLDAVKKILVTYQFLSDHKAKNMSKSSFMYYANLQISAIKNLFESNKCGGGIVAMMNKIEYSTLTYESFFSLIISIYDRVHTKVNKESSFTLKSVKTREERKDVYKKILTELEGARTKVTKDALEEYLLPEVSNLILEYIRENSTTTTQLYF